MRIAQGITEATFVRRESRFSCLVEIPSGKESVYLPNSGRLDQVLLPGQTVFLAAKASRVRKTGYDLVAISVNGTVIAVDSRVAGDLFHSALLEGTLAPFRDYTSIRREVPRGRSRLDFLLGGADPKCFVEVKSVTLAKDGAALFPDAPTRRGVRQLETLIWAKKDGYAAAVVFVIQRGDVESFSPNDAVDAEFGRWLRAAQLQGVDIHAYRCSVTPETVDLAEQVPVVLRGRG